MTTLSEPLKEKVFTRLEREQLLLAFEGAIEPVEVSWGYRLGLVFVAITMILLPLLYIALIGSVSYALYLHLLLNGVPLLNAPDLLDLLVFLVPCLIGFILILFMIKPLFTGWSEQVYPFSLDPEEEPLLFAFVEKICEAINAPMPSRIDVTCDINASASFRRGLLSFLGKDLVLSIGLPLVVGMNTRQLAGVLAHELGHFTQGFGMRLTFIIRTINLWFVRVVYERDAWDERLTHWSVEGNFFLSLSLLFARFLIWITRKILMLFMFFGHLISCFMLREMEYDADRYETRLVGSQTFEDTAVMLQHLGVASQFALARLEESWSNGYLGDDLASMIVSYIDEIPEELKAEMERVLSETTTGLLETHPSEKDRIESAWRESTDGVFQMEHKASLLFSHFSELAKSASFEFYVNTLGEDVQRENLLPTDELLLSQRQIAAGEKATHRYFQGALTGIRPPLRLSFEEPTLGSQEELRTALSDIREAMLSGSEELRLKLVSYDEVDTKILELRQALSLLQAGFSVEHEELYGLDRAGARKILTSTITEQRELEVHLVQYEDLAKERISFALQALDMDLFDELEPFREKLSLVLEGFSLLRSSFYLLLEFREEQATMTVLFSQIEEYGEEPSLFIEIQSVLDKLISLMSSIKESFGDTPYPFRHVNDEMLLSDYLIPKIPDAEEWGELVLESQEVLSRVLMFYSRCMGDVILYAEQVEEHLGLSTLPMPDDIEPVVQIIPS